MTVPAFPLAALERHAAIVGVSGSGKTYAAKGAVELLLQAEARTVVIDPTGVWFGLRSNRDGTAGAYGVPVLGGDHGDMKLPPESGAALGQLLATHDSSAVLDLSAMLLSEQRRFVTALAESLYQHNRQPLHLVVDEADEFLPQRPGPDQTVMLNRMDRIVRRGRNRGFRVLMISQRPAVLNKDALSQARCLVAMKLTSPQDRKALRDWLSGQAAPDQVRDAVDRLPGLETGRGLVWWPDGDLLEERSFPSIATYDSSAAPVAGGAGPLLAAAEPGKLQDLLQAVGASPGDQMKGEGEAAPGTIGVPQAAELEAKLKAVRKAGYAAGYQAGLADWPKQFQAAAQRCADQLAKALRDWAEQVREKHRDRLPKAPGTVAMAAPVIAVAAAAPAAPVSVPKPPGYSRKMLVVLAQAHPACLTEQAWATRAGRSRRSSSWDAARRRLRTEGMVACDPENGLWSATESGRASAGIAADAPAVTGEALVDLWVSKLSRVEGVLLNALWGIRVISRTELANRTGYSRTSSSFEAAIRTLRANGLLRTSGDMLHLTEVFDA